MKTTTTAAIVTAALVGAGLVATNASGASTQTRTSTFDVVEAGTLDDNETQDLFENRLASCMDERGFLYEPVPPIEAPPDGTLSLLTGETFNEAEFTSRYGLGVVENTLIVLRGDPVPLAHDPNQQIFESLPDDEQVKYSYALHGTDGEGGCLDIVSNSFEAPETTAASDYDRLYDEALQEPHVADFLAEWRECMQRAGHAYDTPDDIEAELDAAVAEILNAAVRVFDSGQLSAAEVESAQMSQLTALQEYELSVAAANLRCGVADGRALLDAAVSELRTEQD